MELYMKNTVGEFVPVMIEHVIDPKEWSDKLVVMKLGTDERPATASDEDEFMQALENAEAVISNAKDASIIVGIHGVTLEIKEKGNE